MIQFNIYFGILLLLMALFMGALAMITCIQVFRLRSKRINWRAGTLKGFPLFSTIFLAISVVLITVVWTYGGTREIIGSGLYLVFSASWFISSYFASKRYITDYGIVKNINDPAQTIAWHQIHDFFEQRQGDDWTYTFMYREKNNDMLKNVMRLRLSVPRNRHQAFKNLISHKLGRRISCYEDETINIRNFE